MRTRSSHRYPWPLVLIPTILLGATFQLQYQGRLWWCACGQPFIWTSDAWSMHNSQHLFDPYSFTHVLHGFAFCWLLMIGLPRVSRSMQLTIAIFIEAVWEVIENTQFVIDRYREATAALGYHGDSIANSLGDILACVVGVVIAQRLGFRRTAVIFAITELVLLIWIKDSLLLEILMLIYPIDAIKAWQMGA